MSVVSNNILAGASGQGGAGSYEIERSLRFNPGDSAFLNRNFSTGNRKTYTLSFWIKLNQTGTENTIFGHMVAGYQTQTQIRVEGTGRLEFGQFTGSWNFQKITTRLLRDLSAWYHIVYAVDTTLSTAEDRIKVYINGERETSFSTNTNPSQNLDTLVNSNVEHGIGRVTPVQQAVGGNYYLADVHFIDGQALAPTDFGETDDNGVWQPKKFAGTYFTGVNNATGAVPIYNTTDAFGLVKGTGYQNDSFAGTTNGTGLVLAIPGDVATDVHHNINTGSSQATVTNDGVAVNTSNSRLYGSSLQFESANTDSLTVQNSDMAFGTGDLCVEFWVYNKTNKNYNAFISTRDSNGTTTGFVIASDTGGNLYVHSSAALAGNYSGDLTLPLNQWSHVAYTRASGTHRLFLNGVAASNSTTTSRDFTYDTLKIGDNPYATDEPVNAEMQDIRVYKGVAKYTSNFTVPARTSNGFHLDFKDNSSNAALGTDTSGNSNTWTVNNLVASAPSTATITHARIYCSYGGGTRGANYDVDYSDDGSSWTTAFTGNMTASGCGLITGTGVGNGSYGAHKYWRYVIGSATNNHHPNSARYVLSDGTTDYNVVVYYADNCNDQGSFANVSRILTFPANEEGVDSLVDTPTNGTQTDTGAGGEVVGNYATLNPLAKASGLTLSNGNLDASGSAVQGCATSTIFAPSGKYYCEFTLNTAQNDTAVGVVSTDVNASEDWVGEQPYTVGYLVDGRVFQSASATSYSSYTVGDVIGVAFDVDTGKVWFAKNNTWLNSGNPSAGNNQVKTISGGKPLGFAFRGVGGAGSFNFGQRAFAYTAPSGYKALCTANLPDPTIADGSKYFDTKLVSGNSSTQTVSGLNFSPDFVWAKSRSHSTDHYLFDIVRGATNELKSNSTSAEGSNSGLTQFNSDGYNMGSDSSMNTSGRTYVNWVWDGGTSTVTNNDGSIASQVRANPSAGFSIVTYSGNETGATVGHGLNAPLQMIWIKQRTNHSTTGKGDGNWIVGHTGLGMGSGRLILNGTYTNETSSAGAHWNSTAATSSVFSVGTSGNVNGSNNATYVAYCFAPIEGYSAAFSWSGNGTDDGSFIYLGFRPKFVIMKDINASNNWQMLDAARDPYNVTVARLFTNQSVVENTATSNFDFLSNGLKARNQYTTSLANTNFIGFAFAEHPFKTARAR